MAATAVARLPLAFPEPCVAVAQAPPTEMCGSDARLCRAQPSACSRWASSPYRIPAPTVTVARSGSISMTGGRSATETSTPAVSAMRLNEYPEPRARTWWLPETRSWSSSTLCGRCTRSARYTTLPAQLVGRPVTAHHPLRCQPGNSRASSLGRLDPGLVVGKRDRPQASIRHKLTSSDYLEC